MELKDLPLNPQNDQLEALSRLFMSWMNNYTPDTKICCQNPNKPTFLDLLESLSHDTYMFGVPPRYQKATTHKKSKPLEDTSKALLLPAPTYINDSPYPCETKPCHLSDYPKCGLCQTSINFN